MGFGRELPTSFHDALALAQQILIRNDGIRKKNTVATEAEQIVIAAYRRGAGKALSRVELFSRMRDAFPREAGEHVVTMAMARAEGKLLQHVTGFQVFLDHEYEVGPDVLVPRPETEILARTAIDGLLKTHGEAGPALGVELGIGSGILSIELLKRFPGLRMIATEVSFAAAARARKNAERILGVGSVRLDIVLVKDGAAIFEAVAAPLADFVISNPPYLDPARQDEVEDEVRHGEPAAALFAPVGDSLYFYRKIAEASPAPRVFVEMAAERAVSIVETFRERSWTTEVTRDLNGRERVLDARRKG